MIVLGLAMEHCSSAALMINGTLAGLVQEERFTKRKNQIAFPRRSIEALVSEHLNGEISKIDQVVIGGALSDPYGTFLDRYSNFSVHDHIAENHGFWKPYFYEMSTTAERACFAADYWQNQIRDGATLNHDHNFGISFLDGLSWDETIEEYSSVERPGCMKRVYGYEGPVELVDHHTAHAYYAYYGSKSATENPDDTIIFTADGWGDDSNWSVSIPRSDGKIERLANGPDNIISRLYRFTTLILGMKPNEHEYKVMGLSSYSRSTPHIEACASVFYDALDFVDGAFQSRRPLRDSYFDLKDRLEGHRFDNVAAGLQTWATEVTGKWMTYWISKTGRPIVCFSGGLSMNIKSNGELLRNNAIKKLYVSASGGDESLSAGACFAAQATVGARVEPITNVYLGGCPDDNWQARLEETKLSACDFTVLEGYGPTELATLLADRHIIARCVGPAEFGARSLGNRSILADPRSPDTIAFINNAIKNRDFWMPFTPSVLAEFANQYFDDPKNCLSPWMTIGFETTERARQEIPAALHMADSSARPQCVNQNDNPDYWSLIEAFRTQTGVCALLNTSLNLHGEPMNYSLADAARTVALSELDFLAMPRNRLLCKNTALKYHSDIAGIAAIS